MPAGTSTLVNRNVRVGRRHTSLRLEPALWAALDEAGLLRAYEAHPRAHWPSSAGS